MQKALLEEFFSENREALTRIEQGLLKLEAHPGNRELVNSIFRDMHTVKGNCRMMGFARLEELTHGAETVLDLMREETLLINQEIGSCLLGVLDLVRKTLKHIAQSGSEGKTEFSSTIRKLESFVTNPPPKNSQIKPESPKEWPLESPSLSKPPPPPESSPHLLSETSPESPSGTPGKSPKKSNTKSSKKSSKESPKKPEIGSSKKSSVELVPAPTMDIVPKQTEEPPVDPSKESITEPAAQPLEGSSTGPTIELTEKSSGQLLGESSTETAATDVSEPPTPSVPTTDPSPADDGLSTATPVESIRLSLDRLDALMNQVGELGASFNQLRFVITNRPDQVEQLLEVHGKQIHWLQDEVIKYRLQPIGRIWDQYHRLVRDLSVETGKKVTLVCQGEETEVDRNVLISINELLGHLLRNSMDHGIETPLEREASGKNMVGRITLSAEQKHGQIFLAINDDGRGINPEQILQKALATKLITQEQALEMKEPEIFKLIMLPGFSTAKEVSRISGRGTGMDVVQSALNKVGGTITIDSVHGAGTTFRMTIPQTMAIVPALLVSDGDETFALPQTNVVELVSFYGEEIKTNIEGKMQSPMVRVREKLLPLVPLQQLLTRNGPGRGARREVERIHTLSALHVAVLQGQDTLFGLEVGAILGNASLLIKPLNRIFSHISILAGTAVMPDGSISFLLNVPALLYNRNDTDQTL